MLVKTRLLRYHELRKQNKYSDNFVNNQEGGGILWNRYFFTLT